jgi:PTH1 family peptidyl-tRNA hydrolase
MRVIVGLGNPGEKYEATRHNIGFMVVQRLADAHHGSIRNYRSQSLTGKVVVNGEPGLLVLPQTFMNCCGPALRSILDEASEPPTSMIVVCDDFNLDPGHVRIRPGGSSGGHRGLTSIAEALGTTEFPRLRIGIGHYGPRDPIEFVLDPFSPADNVWVEEALSTAVQVLEVWLLSGIDVAMNRFNRRQRKKSDEQQPSAQTL